MHARLSRIGIANLVGYLVLALTSASLAQQPSFRSGANLVRVDAYVTANGAPVSTLTVDDFEVLEDDVPQRISSFELVARRASRVAPAAADPSTVADMKAAAREPEARLFVLFLDTPHVDRFAAQRASAPVQRVLREVISADDLVGLMTPAQSARAVTFSRRTNSVDALLRDYSKWSEARQAFSSDPAEDEIVLCYGEGGQTTPDVQEKLARYRAARTIGALDDLVAYLEDLREERKFIVVLSEGWYLLTGGATFTQTPAVRSGTGQPPLSPSGSSRVITGCSSEVVTLASADTAMQFQRLLRRASRANVSFYPIDSRGLADAPPPPLRYGWARGGAPAEALRALADQTNGFAVVGTNDIAGGLQRLVRETGDYYLLGYASTNPRLDGRFRKLTVRVKRKDVQVRARPGYTAPTKEDLTVSPSASERPVRLISSLRPIALRRGPSTGTVYVRSNVAEYRRTERLRVEVPMHSRRQATARLLGPAGAPISVPVVMSTRTDANSGQVVLVTDLTLAPLAQGVYELEITLQRERGAEVVPYRFSLIP